MYGDRRDLPVATHSFPTRRLSDLAAVVDKGVLRMEVEIAEVGEIAEPVEIADANASPRPRDRPRAFQFLQRAVDMHRREPEQIGELFLRYRKRSEEHTSELQSLMRLSYAVFRLEKNKLIHL